MNNPPIALSFSRLSDYEICPLKFKQKYIEKSYPDDSNNPAFVKGNAIHKQVEDYINWLSSMGGKAPSMGTYTVGIVPMLEQLYKASNGQVYGEKQIATNQDWDRCDWFDKPHTVKYRAIIDFMVFMSPNHLILGDIKSGKFREYQDGPTTQLKLTTAMCFSLYPKIETITAAYFFVEHKKTVKVVFTRDMIEDLKKPFDEMHHEVNTVKEWPHKKNQYCHFCLVGGDTCPIKR